MTELTQAMDLLRKIFDKYSGKEGDKDTLTKKELTRLLFCELPVLPTSKAEFEAYAKELDADGDGLVTFTEYVNFVTELTVKYC
ncbi:protein S100-G-like [Centropristis striata]|uniref:protein S100-G-like n=1 Tax=Centropristis striata TaxID=184440 RepID=UPI0027E0FDE5|nr:protein S100-G-like [Centropristis striata]